MASGRRDGGVHIPTETRRRWRRGRGCCIPSPHIGRCCRRGLDARSRGDCCTAPRTATRGEISVFVRCRWAHICSNRPQAGAGVGGTRRRQRPDDAGVAEAAQLRSLGAREPGRGGECKRRESARSAARVSRRSPPALLCAERASTGCGWPDRSGRVARPAPRSSEGQRRRQSQSGRRATTATTTTTTPPTSRP